MLSDRPIVVLPDLLRSSLEPRLPSAIDARWFNGLEEAYALAPLAEVGWFDEWADGVFWKAPAKAENARWINTSGVGLDAFPTELFISRGQIVTNGVGLRSDAIAEFAVLGVLALAKGLPDLVRAHDRREWSKRPAGTGELDGSAALIIGYGSIGRAIGDRLRAFGVAVIGVRRSPSDDPNVLGLDDWRGRLGTIDWVIVAAPATPETNALIGKEEMAAMKPGAGIVNIARGSLIDQVALVEALRSGHISGAVLDATTPEPLPADHALWAAPNCLVTSHVSGQSLHSGIDRAIERFLANLDRYLAGEPLEHVVDFSRGY